MGVSRGLILTAVLCAVLAATGAADAKNSKKKRVTQPPAAGATMPGHGMGTTAPGSPTTTDPSGQPGSGFGEPFVLRHFDEIDTDRNGELSRSEITAWVEKARGQAYQLLLERFRAADTNADGQLSREEARVGAPHLYDHFEFVDADGDGQVSLAEIAQLRNRNHFQQRVVALLRQADLDQDGKLNLAEVQVAFPGLAVRFSLLDQDGDGFLTLDELARRVGGV
jgi:Ca2+-binding EF-hand superfamily protein